MPPLSPSLHPSVPPSLHPPLHPSSHRILLPTHPTSSRVQGCWSVWQCTWSTNTSASHSNGPHSQSSRFVSANLEKTARRPAIEMVSLPVYLLTQHLLRYVCTVEGLEDTMTLLRAVMPPGKMLNTLLFMQGSCVNQNSSLT